MKFFILISFSCFFILGETLAQNSKIYVSRHGGKKSIFTLGKLGYNTYHFNNSGTCDTLICFGKGYEICKIDRDIIKAAEGDGKYYPLFNDAILVAQKKSRRSKKKADEFQIIINKKRKC
ncbi:MAG: hypothetical protein K0R26_2222 [Bacteroidota bacterium]|jgi:hypothetical protein|nr:hypothetical protein [Bacteroidota bacterium]